jgi:small ubiquitin-related modifier
MEGEKKVEEVEQPQVKLRVINQQGEEIFFKIRTDTQMGKLMAAYCSRTGAPPASVRFLFDGARFKETDTPKDLGMQEDDVIDAVAEQTGGEARKGK